MTGLDPGGAHFGPGEPRRAGRRDDRRGADGRTLRVGLGLLFAALLALALLAKVIVPAPTAVSASGGPAGIVGPAPTGPLPSAGVPARSTPASTPTTTAPRRGQRATAGHGCHLSLADGATPGLVGHCTVLEIGDSLGNDLGWGLLRHVNPVSGLRLVQADTSSTGLVNTAFWNWPAHLESDLAHYHPQLVLISLGGNDEQGMVVDGSAVQFPTSTWQRAYAARVRHLVKEATRSGAYVLWVGLPVMQQPQFSQGIHVLDRIDQRTVQSNPNAAYLSVWRLFADPAGRFQSDADVNGSATTLREADGIHYSLAGENVLATYVVEHLASIFHVRLSPTEPDTITSW